MFICYNSLYSVIIKDISHCNMIEIADIGLCDCSCLFKIWSRDLTLDFLIKSRRETTGNLNKCTSNVLPCLNHMQVVTGWVLKKPLWNWNQLLKSNIKYTYSFTSSLRNSALDINMFTYYYWYFWYYIYYKIFKTAFC